MTAPKKSLYQLGFRDPDLVNAAVQSLDNRVGDLDFDEDYDYLEENWLQRPALNAVLAPAMSGNDAADVVELVAMNVANKNFEVGGTNMTTALCTWGENGIILTTAGADADEAFVDVHRDTLQSIWAKAAKWGSENSLRMEWRVKAGASIAKTIITSGLKLTATSVIATDDDQAIFHYSSVIGANWQFQTSRAGTDVIVDTGIPVVASTVYRFRMEIAAALTVRCWINNTEVTLSAAAAAALVTAKDFYPFTGVLAVGTTPGAKAIEVFPRYRLGRLAA